ncbi:hypothetical protein AJ79_09671 [Helicocarpus griseus UAMH5409]|uniref:Uncharacterized protein n=1 Tax=Helicocarpus griseus UAMH5409 TaxID=1447875 RepID=A0A2B7WHK0_9EURO|nr:hypothetical protein AJ79_09671 [Helicocarpus griseus UAMH5409]
MDNNNPPPPPPPQQQSQSQRGPRKDDQSPQPPSSEQASQPPSMPSRIQDSASGLLRNTLSSPSSGSVAGDVASTLATGLSGKGGSSSHAPLQSGPSASGHISQSHGLSLGQPFTQAQNQRYPSESFRSTPSTAYDEDSRAWEQFQDPTQNTTNNDTLLLDPSYDTSSAKGKGKGKGRQTEEADPFNTAWHNSTSTSISTADTLHKPSHIHTYTPTPTDGQAVVSLLASPTFQPATFTPPDSPHSELFELDESMLPSSTTTTTSSLSTTIPSFPPNQLSLIPDIDSILSAVQEGQHDWTQMPGVAEWLEVDQSYHDTVWGFLKPYAEAAKKEVEERREEGVREEDVREGPAVKRLGMVLGHLRARL